MLKTYKNFVKNCYMFDFYLYDLNDFYVFEDVFKLGIENTKQIVFLCVGTKKYKQDSFGVLMGDKIKKLKVFCYGCSKREINGLNYSKVYEFVKKKHQNSKIIIVDSIFIEGGKKPILIFKSGGVVVSALNNKMSIGDAGILFNAFSYNNDDIAGKIMQLIENMIKNFIKI